MATIVPSVAVQFQVLGMVMPAMVPAACAATPTWAMKLL